MKDKNKILFISTQFPMPLDKGGKIATFQHLRELSRIYHIDFACFIDPIYSKNILKYKLEFKKKIPVKSIYLVEKRIYTNKYPVYFFFILLISFILKKPFKVFKFWDYKMRVLLDSLARNNNYNIIVFDQLPSTLYYNIFNKYVIKSYLLSHNLEFKIVNDLKNNTRCWLKKMIFGLEAKLLYNYEIKAYKNISNILFLSEDDRDYVRLKIQQCHCQLFDGVYKYFCNIIPKKKYCLNNNILFLGSLSWGPNLQGLEWFLKKVWINIYHNYKLNIVGSTPLDRVASKLNKFKNINYIGSVDNLDNIFKKNDILIIPLFSGSGIKIKTIEALARGMPIIGTSKAFDGIHGLNDAYQLANDEISFSNKIQFLLNEKNSFLLERIGRNNRIFFEKKISSNKTTLKLFINGI